MSDTIPPLVSDERREELTREMFPSQSGMTGSEYYDQATSREACEVTINRLRDIYEAERRELVEALKGLREEIELLDTLDDAERSTPSQENRDMVLNQSGRVNYLLYKVINKITKTN